MHLKWSVLLIEALLNFPINEVVTTKKYYKWSKESKPYKVAAIDYGIKLNILRLLDKHDCEVTIFPAHISAEEITQITAETFATLYSNYSKKNFVQTIVPSSWSTDLILSLWEGGQLAPDLPLASVKSLSDDEYGKNQFGFKKALVSQAFLFSF